MRECLMNKIKASTPGKLMLFGEHSVVHNHPCLVAAVDQRFLVTVEKIKGDELVVKAPAVGIYERKKLDELGTRRISKGLRFIEMTVKRFYEGHQNGGLKVVTENHFSSKYGFGSSAAVTVGLANALFELEKIKISDKELFDFCYQVVLDVQGVGSGFDIAAALYGEVLCFVTGGREIRRLRFRTKTSESSEPLPIVVGYTGIKADTPTLVRQVGEIKRQHPVKVNKWFREITEIVNLAEKKINKGDWEEVGELMNKNQLVLQKLQVSSVELDRLIEACLKAGAYGAKLSGAGGGDCMIAVTSEEKRKGVEKAIVQAGGEVLRVNLGAVGARIER